MEGSRPIRKEMTTCPIRPGRVAPALAQPTARGGAGSTTAARPVCSLERPWRPRFLEVVMPVPRPIPSWRQVLGFLSDPANLLGRLVVLALFALLWLVFLNVLLPLVT